jgi:hypothetical protein
MRENPFVHPGMNWIRTTWLEVVTTALLDRLLHHAVVVQIEGASYRLRLHADLIPEHIRSQQRPLGPPEFPYATIVRVQGRRHDTERQRAVRCGDPVPVANTKHRKPKFVLMSMDDYAQLGRLASPPDGLTELAPQEDDPLEDWSRTAPGS